MAYMDWSENLSVGVKEIDNQHKNLIKMINEFYVRMMESDRSACRERDRIALGKLLSSLVEYTVYHFQAEEKYMDKFNYADTPNHKQEHRFFVEKVMDIKKRFDDGLLVLSVEATNFVKDWIIEHVMGSDKNYSECFIENGLK